MTLKPSTIQSVKYVSRGDHTMIHCVCIYKGYSGTCVFVYLKDVCGDIQNQYWVFYINYLRLFKSLNKNISIENLSVI